MSTNTHLRAISLLPGKFYGKDHLVPRVIRIVGMVTVAGLVIALLVPTVSHYWGLVVYSTTDLGVGIAAKCFYQRQFTEWFDPGSIWSFILIVGSCVWKAVQLHSIGSKRSSSIRTALLGRLSRSLDHILERRQTKPTGSLWLGLRYAITTSLYIILWFSFEISISLNISLWICGGGLMWGTLKILLVRRNTHSSPDRDWSEESKWGFGQILPMLLLILPWFAILEGWYGTFDLPQIENH